jgi:hypothetical protein
LLSEELDHEPTVAMFRARLAAEQGSTPLEGGTRKYVVDATALHQRKKLRLVGCPVAFTLLVRIQDVLSGGQQALVLVGRAHELSREVGKVPSLGEPCQLRRVVQPNVEKPLNASTS